MVLRHTPAGVQVNLRQIYLEGLLPARWHVRCLGKTPSHHIVVMSSFLPCWTLVTSFPLVFTRDLQRRDSPHWVGGHRSFPNPTPHIPRPRASLYFNCFATLQTIYRNVSTFFSLTSDFFIHPFLHLIRDESHSPLATSSKSPNRNHVTAV